jgi:hypothetical protein
MQYCRRSVLTRHTLGSLFYSGFYSTGTTRDYPLPTRHLTPSGLRVGPLVRVFLGLLMSGRLACCWERGRGSTSSSSLADDQRLSKVFRMTLSKAQTSGRSVTKSHHLLTSLNRAKEAQEKPCSTNGWRQWDNWPPVCHDFNNILTSLSNAELLRMSRIHRSVRAGLES